MKIPGIIIAGTNSGCGKTTITAGIMAALKRRRMIVQPYKIGPDYIDPMFHTFITGRYSRNLDSWLLDVDTVRYLLAKNFSGADIAVIEGVMGLYDGLGVYSTEGSTAHVAKITGMPVVLVINGEGMSLSAAALVKGFLDFETGVNIKGVIINNLMSESHYKLLKDIIEEKTGVTVFGYLKRNEDYILKSRHLGLIQSCEIENLSDMTERLSEAVLDTVDLEGLIRLARETNEICWKNEINAEPMFKGRSIKVAVAMDKAFNFYYKDNLDLLESLGAEIQYFSPLEDNKLPDDINGIYIGGGYPEVFARKLYENKAFRDDIKRRITDGLTTYAECGGFMYLTESIKDADGDTYDMVGIYPGRSMMTNSLQRFGYVEVEIDNDNVMSPKGNVIRAHEFHCSMIEMDKSVEACFNVYRKRLGSRDSSWKCGYKIYNALAGYPHMHFWSNMEFARTFLKNCAKL